MAVPAVLTRAITIILYLFGKLADRLRNKRLAMDNGPTIINIICSRSSVVVVVCGIFVVAGGAGRRSFLA